MAVTNFDFPVGTTLYTKDKKVMPDCCINSKNVDRMYGTSYTVQADKGSVFRLTIGDLKLYYDIEKTQENLDYPFVLYKVGRKGKETFIKRFDGVNFEKFINYINLIGTPDDYFLMRNKNIAGVIHFTWNRKDNTFQGDLRDQYGLFI